MNVLQQILLKSPIGNYPMAWKSLVVGLFAAIVLTLFWMLGALLIYGRDIPIRFGY